MNNDRTRNRFGPLSRYSEEELSLLPEMVDLHRKTYPYGEVTEKLRREGYEYWPSHEKMLARRVLDNVIEFERSRRADDEQDAAAAKEAKESEGKSS